MNSIKKIFAGLFVLLAGPYLSQDKDHHKAIEKHHITLKQKDSVCLQDCFVKAHWEAHSRSFFMSTFNEGALKDDYALASGAGIGLLTHSIYGFQLGVSGFFIYNLLSSELHQPDSITGQMNRYELGLFDIESPKNKHDLDRLEDLYLKYNFSKSAITIGKMHINTPFINLQDGRMRPTIAEGAWLNIHESEKFGINGGWIWDVSPRSTVRWFSLGESMGVNPMGVNTNGTRSDYKDNIHTSGMAIANIYYNPTNKLKINLWNGYLNNVMNSAMIEINAYQKLSDSKQLYQGLIYMHQDALNHGGNADQSKTYINRGSQSNIISAQLGMRNKKNNTSLNYTHITGDGRYLMPREWGRDPFYTFLQRERNEGFGNVHAIVLKTSQTMFRDKFRTGIGYGYYLLPDVKNYRLNKYGLPSYHQLNVDASYNFEKFLKGMEIRFLAMYKMNQGETYNNPRFIYNKVNVLNLNLIIDFKI